MNASTIRKSVADLMPDDIERFPIWEFALDEEGLDGQDESTVRPVVTDGVLDISAGMFVVRASFVFAGGGTAVGYLTPPVQEDSSMGTLQPVVLTESGQVIFWWGSIAPGDAELAEGYRRLGEAAPGDVFPLSFRSEVPLSCGSIAGSLLGFIVLEDLRTGVTRVLW